MLSRRGLILSARLLRSSRAPQLRAFPLPVVQQFRSYADKVVKVPEMAESISEGTLKQWSKQIGDYVEQDEEIATIETDKVCSLPNMIKLHSSILSFQIDVAVNAPEAGTIKEFLANEEDTVTVGQDLVLLELGGAPSGGEKEKGDSEPKEPASKDKSTSSDPEPSKTEESTRKEESSPPPPPPEEKHEKKSEPKKETPPAKQTESKSESKSGSTPGLGNREERRV
jgi:2-oxoglutarate dehydrogenase E2 component (dihydrolipoamide succinyltransferase)